MKFAIIKGQITFLLNKKLGKRACVATDHSSWRQTSYSHV